MPAIRRLPADVSKLIAAGEVVERPASALKELLENALDAGATAISVEARGAGSKSLRVTDNGCGMSREDCALALERHATSKIAAIEDLSALSTYGFRGEALFALASVSRLTLTSAQAGASSGWRLEAEGGKILSSKPAAAPRGTSVEIKDLFFNTPARRKFLKSDAFEKSALSAVFEEAALANPETRLSYKSESRMQARLPPAETGKGDPFQRRLAAVWGRELSEGLLPLSIDRPGLQLKLFASPPGKLAASRDFQLWFVNRRPIASRLLQQALYRAYRDLRGSRHPVCAAFLDLPPDAFDVNVHPGKREVRFKDERNIFALVEGLVSGALTRARTPTALFAAPRGFAPAESLLRDRMEYHPGPGLALESPAAEAEPREGGPAWFTPPYRYLGQIEKSYLLFEAAGGLFVLDQHAAAERILFERYGKELERGPVATQRLMLPVSIELPASRLSKVLGLSARLSALGFEVAPAGRQTLHVLTAPRLFDAAGLKEIILRVLDSLENPAHAVADARRHAVATIACKAAVKAHDALSPSEAMKLLEDLKDCDDGSCCPHGRRAMLALDREELARRFQRPGAPPR